MSAFRHVLAMAVLALPTAAFADPAPGNIKLGPIACDSPHHLYNILNAATRRDSLRIAHYEAAACETLAGRHYEIVREMNGVTQIRIFAAEGDWARSRLAYTLDEMLTPSVPSPPDS
ncbi:MAG: hypothetical protein JO255_21050 [Alphaproteobacteria bacterium]|nr:hypothetical protein [Alphaproteobacteria bacterium]